MKRVKVERYVAGKKPTYARDDDEDSIYESEEEEEEVEDEDQADQGTEVTQNKNICEVKAEARVEVKERLAPCPDQEDDDDDDDDDPRFRKLKQVKVSHFKPKLEASRTVVIDEDDDDDEEEVRRRHLIAKSRRVEEPIGPAAIFGDEKFKNGQEERALVDVNYEDDDEYDLLARSCNQAKRIDTDDLLKDFVPTGIGLQGTGNTWPSKTEEEREEEQKKIREALEQAKEEVRFKQQVNKKIEQDLKRELEREAMAKGDIGAREMTSVDTDDDDDEIAYEEWKLREIKRILRDRSARRLDARSL